MKMPAPFGGAPDGGITEKMVIPASVGFNTKWVNEEATEALRWSQDATRMWLAACKQTLADSVKGASPTVGLDLLSRWMDAADDRPPMVAMQIIQLERMMMMAL